MRRSTGATSSPGGRRPPVHSTSRGGRPRSASGASRKARPLAKAVANSSAQRPRAVQGGQLVPRCRRRRPARPGRAARAARTSAWENMPRAVASSVTVCGHRARSLTAAADGSVVGRGRRPCAAAGRAVGRLHLDHVEHGVERRPIPVAAPQGPQGLVAGAAGHRGVGGDEHEGDVRDACVRSTAALPSAFHSVSVRRSPARVLVNAPDTSKYHRCPVASRAEKLDLDPVARLARRPSTSAKPQCSSSSRASSRALCPWRTARATTSVPSSGLGPGRRPTTPSAAPSVSASSDRGRLVHAQVLLDPDPLLGDLHVGRLGVVARRSAGRCARRPPPSSPTHERVEHEIVAVGVQLDQPQRQLHRERRRVPHPGGPLGRRSPTRRWWPR